MANTTIAFSCDTERDRDILTWLDELREQKVNKSGAIRKAIRAGRAVNSWTIGDVMAELGEIRRTMRAGVVVSQDEIEPDAGSDPLVDAAQDALNGLGL